MVSDVNLGKFSLLFQMPLLFLSLFLLLLDPLHIRYTICSCAISLGNFFFRFCHPFFSVFKVSIHISSRSEIVFSPNLLISLSKALFVSVQRFSSLFLFGSFLGFPALCLCYPSVLACLSTLPVRTVVPSLFGTRDRFHGRQFFHGLGHGVVVWVWFKPITFIVHFISIIIISSLPQIIRH